MKIWFVTPCSREFAGPFAEVLETTIKKFPREGTTVTCGWISEGEQPFSTPTLHQFALATNGVAMANSIIVAEKQGYDAGIVGCTIDPGLYAARSVVDIPVTACTESAVLLSPHPWFQIFYNSTRRLSSILYSRRPHALRFN